MAVRRKGGRMQPFCTSYCNKAHDLRDGWPIEHECYVLPKKALDLEKDGNIEEAIKLISAKQPLRPNSGKSTKDKRPKLKRAPLFNEGGWF